MDNNLMLFYQGNKLKAIFNDKKVMKEKTLHYILDYYLEKGIYKSKQEAGHKLKSKILGFYKEHISFLEAHNIIWSIVKVNTNQIEDSIKNSGYRTNFTKIKVKGFKCNKKDLYRDLAYLEVESLYTKK